MNEISCRVFIATSLDGYIARKDGSLDWLDKANQTVTKGEDCGFSAFMNEIDVLVMGRNTFEKVLSFGQWFYEKPVVVLSTKNLEIPDHLQGKVRHENLSPTLLIEKLLGLGYKKVYVDGGKTIQSFLEAKLINEIIITQIPVILGSGIPLFGELREDVSLELLSTKSYEFGFVQSKFKVVSELDVVEK